MTDTINGRTPEEIKQGMECCSVLDKCDKCPYCGMPCNDLELNRDALALVQYLERERDAAVEAVGKLADNCDRSIACEYCEFRDYQCIVCEFKWRGVPTKEEI